MTFIFNLSKDSQIVPLSAVAEIACASGAAVVGDALNLDGNGFAYLSHSDGRVI